MNTLHQQPAMFREALTLTRQQTGFSERLIEKDYFCTVLLEYLASGSGRLVFKGGTCLAKVHANFYRLSEDLDFVIPMATDAPRAQRRQQAAGLKEIVAHLPARLTGFRIVAPLTGANNSTQYVAVACYASLVTGGEETIKIEVGLREPLLLSVTTSAAQTILLDPITRQPLVRPLTLHCIAKQEAFAEKFRAALTRRDVAVRDFFDLDYAVRKLGLQMDDPSLIQLVRRKLAVPGNDRVNVSAERLAELRRQVAGQLQPVLRTQDLADFDVERAFGIVTAMAQKAG